MSAPHVRRTKIVATIGPASSTPEIVRDLVRAGMDAARLNMSHGGHEDHARRAELVRQVFTARLGSEKPEADTGEPALSAHSKVLRTTLHAARQAVLAMRAKDEIGDDAFHQMEEELDWLEMADGGRQE